MLQTPEIWELVATNLQKETALDIIHPSVEHTHLSSSFAENKTQTKTQSVQASRSATSSNINTVCADQWRVAYLSLESCIQQSLLLTKLL